MRRCRCAWDHQRTSAGIACKFPNPSTPKQEGCDLARGPSWPLPCLCTRVSPSWLWGPGIPSHRSLQRERLLHSRGHNLIPVFHIMYTLFWMPVFTSWFLSPRVMSGPEGRGSGTQWESMRSQAYQPSRSPSLAPSQVASILPSHPLPPWDRQGNRLGGAGSLTQGPAAKLGPPRCRIHSMGPIPLGYALQAGGQDL